MVVFRFVETWMVLLTVTMDAPGKIPPEAFLFTIVLCSHRKEASKPAPALPESIHKPLDRTVISPLHISGETAGRELAHSTVVCNTFAAYTEP